MSRQSDWHTSALTGTDQVRGVALHEPYASWFHRPFTNDLRLWGITDDLVRFLLQAPLMKAWARLRVVFGAACAGLAALALVSACSGDGARTNEGGSAGSAGAVNEAGAAGKGSSGSSQSGSGNGGGGQSLGGKGGASGAGTSSAGAGNGLDSPCHSDGDCPMASGFPGPLYCNPPGASQGCGACPGLIPTTDGCSSDLDCRKDGGTKICVRPCGGACPMGSCVAGCTEETCPTGAACGTDGRCQAKACTAPSACPQDYACLNSVCVRRPCKADAECDGYCVVGACYSALGACVRPAA